MLAGGALGCIGFPVLHTLLQQLEERLALRRRLLGQTPDDTVAGVAHQAHDVVCYGVHQRDRHLSLGFVAGRGACGLACTAAPSVGHVGNLEGHIAGEARQIGRGAILRNARAAVRAPCTGLRLGSHDLGKQRGTFKAAGSSFWVGLDGFFAAALERLGGAGDGVFLLALRELGAGSVRRAEQSPLPCPCTAFFAHTFPGVIVQLLGA